MRHFKVTVATTKTSVREVAAESEEQARIHALVGLANGESLVDIRPVRNDGIPKKRKPLSAATRAKMSKAAKARAKAKKAR